MTLWAAVATSFSCPRAPAGGAGGGMPGRPNWKRSGSRSWRAGASLLVCLGTPLFVRFPGFGFFRDPKANDWQEIEKSERIAAARKALGDRNFCPSYNFTGAGEASAAFLLGRLLATRKQDLLLTRSSILSWQQIADNDVVFLGPPKFNLQLQAAALTQDIVVEPDGIRNLKPNPGEPVFLEDHIVAGQTAEGETHALITRTAGPSGAGELLMLAGNASADTLAAAEWLTQPWHARELVGEAADPVGRDSALFPGSAEGGVQAGYPGAELVRVPPRAGRAAA